MNQGFRPNFGKSSEIYFCITLTWATIFWAAHSLPVIGLSLKSNHRNQVNAKTVDFYIFFPEPLKISFSHLICLFGWNGEPIQLFCVHCNNNLRWRRRPCVEYHHFTRQSRIYETKIKTVFLLQRGKKYIFIQFLKRFDFLPDWFLFILMDLWQRK